MVSSSEKEQNIQLALKQYTILKLETPKPNLSKIARDYDVSPAALRRRTLGVGDLTTRKAHNKRLTDVQEEILLDYVTLYDELRAPIGPHMIQDAANQILNAAKPEGAPPTKPLNKTWALAFMKRQREFFKGKRQLKDYKRGSAEFSGDILWWMGQYTNIIEARGIQDSDIYNMDETGFRIGVGRRIETVYTRYPRYIPTIDSKSTQKLITSVECISRDGFALPPMLIVPGVVQLEEWYTKTDIPDSYIIETSDSGYINSELAYLWLLHFDVFSYVRQQGRWRLLIYDQHKTHMTKEFACLAEQLDILLLPLLPNLTHLLQPLDPIPFMQEKKNHADAVNKVSYLSGYNYDKVHFLNDIDAIRKKTFTPRVIAAGWRETGLWPYDPDLIKKRVGIY
jgi:hypothetical protein